MLLEDRVYLGVSLALSLVGYFITLSPFWIVFFIAHIIPIKDNKLLIPGISIGLFVILILCILSYPQIPCIVDVGQKTILKAVTIGQYQIPLGWGIPLYVLASPFPPNGGIFIVKASLTIQSSHAIFPLLYFSMTDICCIEPLELSASLLNPNHFPWSNTSNITQEFFKCLWMGEYPYQAIWFNTMGHMGLMHLLCLSGYHVSLLEKICFKNKSVFLGLASCFMFLLKGAYPFSRALSYKVLRMNKIKSTPAVLYSLLIPLLLQPLVWTTWSFWLTLYYVLLFYSKIPHMGWLKLFSLGWSILFTGKICVPLILIGIFFEEFLIGVIFPFCYFGISLVAWTPGIFNEFFGAIDLFCTFVNPLTQYTINCPSWLVCPLLIAPFFISHGSNSCENTLSLK